MNIEGKKIDLSIEEIKQLRIEREQCDSTTSDYNFKSLPDDPAEIYDYLLDTERQLIPRGDYVVGSATFDNEILRIAGTSGVLLTAEHATVHQRTRKNGTVYAKEEDHGTGALGVVLGRYSDSDALIALGRQTGDANSDAFHPLKDLMAEVIAGSCSEAHLSLHGLGRAIATDVRDKKGFQVFLGIGEEPSEATNALADFLIEVAADMGLRIGVNQPFLRFNTTTKEPILNDEGTIKTRTFGAFGKTTRSHAQAIAEKSGKDRYATIQLELSDVLRCHPLAAIEYPSQRDRELGSYLGYHFVRQAISAVEKL